MTSGNLPSAIARKLNRLTQKRLLCAAILPLGLLAPQLHAATDTWTGANSANWNDINSNWSGGNPQPANGDLLVFTGASGNETTNNDVTNLSIAGLTFAA